MEEHGDKALDASPVKRTDQRIDEMMSLVLRTGVITAAFFVVIGGAFYLMSDAGHAPDYHVFHGEPEALRSVFGIIHQALKLRGPGLIQFGLLLLIATPIARVAFSLVAFLHERDWLYAAFTFIVLGLLLYSLLGRHG